MQSHTIGKQPLPVPKPMGDQNGPMVCELGGSSPPRGHADVGTIRLVPSCGGGGPTDPYSQPDAEFPAHLEYCADAGCDGVRHHPQTGERHLDLLKWGLLPYLTKDPVHAKRPINARAETVATSGMFRSAFGKRRCLVPANVFYEWKVVGGGKQPYASRARMVSQGRSLVSGKGSSGRMAPCYGHSRSSPPTPTIRSVNCMTVCR